MPKNVDINIPGKDSKRIVIYYPKALVNSYNGNDYRHHSFGNYTTVWAGIWADIRINEITNI